MAVLAFPAAVVLSKKPRNENSKRRFGVRASFSSSPFSVREYDLYDLLGLDCSSDQSQIKSAYRRLQKRCHPDIAGPAGHDMAIVLNEAYAVLSDPLSRSAYDEVRAKTADLNGFTGRPLYSVWCGAESEQRAVFVDEVKCVGCLKCALVARKTFAIETVYGRARVVGQWADPEEKILSAIDACPVDCISMVERSDLPALEHLMSKQPRSHVSMTAGAAAAGNIFSDAKKFQKRHRELMNKVSQDTPIDFAVQGIKSIALFWFMNSTSTVGIGSLVKTSNGFDHTERLRNAAARRAEGATNFAGDGEEYWSPVLLPLPPPVPSNVGPVRRPSLKKEMGIEPSRRVRPLPTIGWIPELVAVVAAGIVGGGGGSGGGLERHMGGAVALEIVNSVWMRALLAGIAWYIVAAAAVGLVALLLHRTDD